MKLWGSRALTMLSRQIPYCSSGRNDLCDLKSPHVIWARPIETQTLFAGGTGKCTGDRADTHVDRVCHASVLHPSETLATRVATNLVHAVSKKLANAVLSKPRQDRAPSSTLRRR